MKIKIHLVENSSKGLLFLSKDPYKKRIKTFNKYMAYEFKTEEEGEAVKKFFNSQGYNFVVENIAYYETLESLTVSFTEYKVKIMLGTDLLLFTNNNINAYKKLWKALEGVEAKPFIIELEGTKVFESADKHTLYKELNKFLEN